MYDAALMAICYTQHALRPVINSESNHNRHFIPFSYKGIDFVDLPSIFQDKSMTQSIPTYLQNSEPPIIVSNIQGVPKNVATTKKCIDF